MDALEAQKNVGERHQVLNSNETLLHPNTLLYLDSFPSQEPFIIDHCFPESDYKNDLFGSLILNNDLIKKIIQILVQFSRIQFSEDRKN